MADSARFSPDSVSFTGTPDVVQVDSLSPGEPTVNVTVESETDGATLSQIWFYGKYVLILLVLVGLGYNVFYALGDAADGTVSIFGPLLKAVGLGMGTTVKGTADTAAEGGKFALDAAAGVVGSATDFVTGASREVEARTKPVEAKVNKAMRRNRQSRIHPPPTADDATSKTQLTNRQRKGGFCYIGEDNGVRSCLHVNDSSMCMSGDVFPTRDICVNPRLRE